MKTKTRQIEKVSFLKLSNFTPKQKLALETTKNYKYVLVGGTKGSGKSYFLRWAALYWLLKFYAEYDVKGILGALFCETYPALEDRHLKKIRQEFPSWLGTYYEQKHEFRLKDEYGGGILAFRNLDNPDKYETSEFAIIAVDEVQNNPLKVFQVLRTRLRFPPIPNEKLKFIAAGIPGGHSWVRQYWIERNFSNEELERNQFYFVPAALEDNPYLGDSYRKSLESLPEVQRRAYLEGDWFAFDEVQSEEGWIRLFTFKDLEDLQIEKELPLIRPVLGVDVGAGGDKTAIVARDKLTAKILFAKKLSDTMQIVPLVYQYVQELKPISILIDITGVGKGVYDRLMETPLAYCVKGIEFGASPEDKKRFFNKKAELYWKTYEWLKRGGKLIKNDLWSELLNIRYKIHSDLTIKFESKEEIKKQGLSSPDVFDALSMTLVEDLQTNEIYQQVFFNQQENWL